MNHIKAFIKKEKNQFRHNLIQLFIITGSILTIFIICLFNWSYDHNFYDDIFLLFFIAIFCGLLSSSILISLAIHISNQLSLFRNQLILNFIVYMHLPFYLLWLFPFHIHIKGIGSINRYLLMFILLSYILMALIIIFLKTSTLWQRILNLILSTAKKEVELLKRQSITLLIISCSILTLLIISQLNWAYDHNFYDDIFIRLLFASIAGLISSALFISLALHLIKKISTFNDKKILKYLSFAHIPLYLFLLYPFHIKIPAVGFINRYLAVMIFIAYFLLWMIFLYMIFCSRKGGNKIIKDNAIIFSNGSKYKYEKFFLILVILFLSIVILFTRLHVIDSDPNPNLTASTTFYGDEGYHSCNALKKYLTGRWMCDIKNHMLVMPFMQIIQYLFISTVGLSLYTARMPAALLSIFIFLPLSIFMLKRHKSTNEALKCIIIIIFFLGFNYYMFNYSNLAQLDIPMASIGCLALLLFYLSANSKKDNIRYTLYAISGIFIGISYLTKPSGLIFAMIVIFAVLLKIVIEGKINKQIIIGLFTAIVFAVITIIAAKALLAGAFQEYMYTVPDLIHTQIKDSMMKFPRPYTEFFKNAIVIKYKPFLYAACISILVIINNSTRNKSIDLIDSLFISFLIVTFLFLGFFWYKPNRYFTIILIPISYFVATLPVNIANLSFIRRKELHKKSILKYSYLILIIICICFYQWDIIHINNTIKKPLFTIRDAARGIKNDIEKNNENINNKKVIVGALISGIMAMENNLNFTFENKEREKQNNVTTYFLTRSKDSDGNLEYINSYHILKRDYSLFRQIE